MIGVGVGMSIATWFSAAVSELPAGKFGVGNATLRTIQQICYAIGISVVIAIGTSFGTSDLLSGFRWSWTYVGAAFMISAAVVVWTFPSGSAAERQAAAAV